MGLLIFQSKVHFREAEAFPHLGTSYQSEASGRRERGYVFLCAVAWVLILRQQISVNQILRATCRAFGCYQVLF